ncbi:MAG: NAD(P)/FAD-dependent oxidoreductase [Bacteroidota bacterium]
MAEDNSFEVIIIGGSYAGLSAAMALGRSRRKVLVIDSGTPCNRQTPHSHNFLTQDGNTPAEIAALSRDQVLKYASIQMLDDFAVKGQQKEDGFTIHTQSGKEFHAKKLIFATGIKDIMPDIAGMAECWGISVIHCPYCHGYEYRDQKTGILANAERAFHLASLVNNLTDELSIITAGKADFDHEQSATLQRHNIKIEERKIIAIEHTNGFLQQVVLEDGSKLPFNAIYAGLDFEQQTDIPASLGCELDEHGYIEVDQFQKTNIDGIFACGDNASFMRSIANAVYRGNVAGAIVNMELSQSKFLS